LKRVKAGVIGMGFIGPIHLEALRRLHYVDIAAIASSNEERAKTASEKYGVSKFYGNWEDLVKNPEIEVIHICTPNDLHYPIAKLAMSLGKHVICDKPLTLDKKQSEELVALAEKTGVVNAVTFNTYYYPIVQQAKILVDKGELGHINYLQGNYLQDWMLFDTDYNWRVEAKYQGESRVIGDVGVHCLFMLQSIIGQKITEVYSDFNTFIEKRKKPLERATTYKSSQGAYEEITVDTDDQATLLLKFDRGTKGVFIGGQCFAGRKNKMDWEIYGSKKSLAWNSEAANELWIGNRLSANEILMKDFNLLDGEAADMCDFTGGIVEGFSETWKNLMRNIYGAVLEGRHNDSYPSFKDGLQIQKVVDAAVESSRQGKWVRVD
jgi:predicted dehydrogenase